MKVPRWLYDYSEDDPKIEKRKNRFNFWNELLLAKQEYLQTHKEYDTQDFISWIEEMYGLKVIYDTTSNGYTDDYEILDEKKFIVYILKYRSDNGYND